MFSDGYSILGNVTGAMVNVDECKVHENKDGRVDKTRSDLYLHFVDPLDNSVMEVAQVLRLIDEHIEKLDNLFKVNYRVRLKYYYRWQRSSHSSMRLCLLIFSYLLQYSQVRAGCIRGIIKPRKR